MRALLVKWLVGFLASFFLTSAHADVIPATVGTQGTCRVIHLGGLVVFNQMMSLDECISIAKGLGTTSASGDVFTVAEGWVATYSGPTVWAGKELLCVINPGGGCGIYSSITYDWSPVDSYSCPSGYDGPKKINGQPNMCEKPDCPPRSSPRPLNPCHSTQLIRH